MNRDNLALAFHLLKEEYTYVTVNERLPIYFLNEMYQLFPEIKSGKMDIKYNTIGYKDIGEIPLPNIQKSILEHNELDQELYRYVKENGKIGKLC